MVRYNLVAFQLERTDFLPLFPIYPQVIILQKIGDEESKNFNVWVDGVMSSMIRNGNAYGKRINAKQYARSLYNISRMLSTLDDDMIDSVKIFPHARHHFYWNSNVAYPKLTEFQPFKSAPQ
ncbi:MAG: hypothetical protein IJH12_03095 [Clostridia bacterium]|nr:hypothetical protein [Clostridia bacterium]